MKKMKRLTALATWITTLFLAGTSHAALITFQQGLANAFTGAGVYTGVEDTVLDGGSPSVNFGTDGGGSLAGVRSDGVVYHGIMRFNLGDLPAGSTVTGAATLKLKANWTMPYSVGVYEVLGASGSWQELSSTFFHLDNSGAGTAWAGSNGASTADIDYNATLLDSGIVNTKFDWLELTIPQVLVQSWIDTPSTNSGLLFKLIDETLGTTKHAGVFYSDAGTIADRPILEVSVIPEPNTLLLFLGASFSFFVIFSLRRQRHATPSSCCPISMG